MFNTLLLDALRKSPPQSIAELQRFFQRSRERLEESLDKGAVTGEARTRYLDQFEEAVAEVQVVFLDEALDGQFGAGKGGDGKASPTGLRQLLTQPTVLALACGLFVLGLLIGWLLLG